jgi:CMP-N,N'-diacetyllegionaminic acid synthase
MMSGWAVLIPARGGSKSIRKKNLLPLRGVPLIEYSVRTARDVCELNKVYITTDSKEISRCGVELGVRIVNRPSGLAADSSRDSDYLFHFADWLLSFPCDSLPQFVLLLRPTCPERDSLRVKAAMNFFELIDSDSMRSVCPAKQTPYKMWSFDPCSHASMKPLILHESVYESYNAPRQELPDVYWQDGYLECIKMQSLLDRAYPGKISGWLNEQPTYDIDRLEDLPEFEKLAKAELERHMALDKKIYSS